MLSCLRFTSAICMQWIFIWIEANISFRSAIFSPEKNALISFVLSSVRIPHGMCSMNINGIATQISHFLEIQNFADQRTFSSIFHSSCILRVSFTKYANCICSIHVVCRAYMLRKTSHFSVNMVHISCETNVILKVTDNTRSYPQAANVMSQWTQVIITYAWPVSRWTFSLPGLGYCKRNSSKQGQKCDYSTRFRLVPFALYSWT